jgi:hypothetical protein
MILKTIPQKLLKFTKLLIFFDLCEFSDVF